MSTVTGPCSIDECRNLATRQTPHGPLCDAHRKRLQPSRAGGLNLTAPVQQRLETRDQLREAAIAYIDDSDSEDEDSGELADAKLARAAVRYATSFIESLRENETEERRKEASRARLRAMRRGVRYGPPPKVDRAAAEHAVKQAGGIRAAARLLGISHQSILKALKRRGPRESNPDHGALHALGDVPSPPTDGGSKDS